MQKLNKAPIFIQAFARGGSNILTNLILSHPNVCITNGETQKVFKGTRWDSKWRTFQKKIFYDLPLQIILRENFFSPRNFRNRKPVPLFLNRYIDRILYEGRFKALIESHNLFKSEDTYYSMKELSNCRLLTKGLNGLVFTAELFSSMYSDATFFALIRNGFALCEGYLRRGYSPEEIGVIYRTVVEQMINNQKYIPNYHILRYEEMVSEPLKFTSKLYNLAKLNLREVKKIRLQSKPIINSAGKHILLKGSNRQVFWYDLNKIDKHVRKNINKIQISRLKNRDKDRFLKIAGNTMEKLNYI